MLRKLIDSFTCIHRHDVHSHPQCFAEGKVNPNKVAELEELYGKRWYQHEGLKIGYLDIETDNLKADYGTILSWCIKAKDGPVYYDVITKEELFNGEVDRRIVESCIAKMLDYRIIVTYYGTVFDLTFLRAKALHYDLYFPGYVSEEKELKNGGTRIVTNPELYHFDLYFTCKSKLASLSSKSLANVCSYLNIQGKTPIDKETWRKAKYGDPVALAEVLEHNVGDVEILELLHNRLTPFQKFTRRGI
jgi:uncharacterized protein YprB with RNaseH-like and TPR domain